MKQQLIILIGPPGSGKGTISQMVVERLPFEHVSIGNLLKWQAASGGELGAQIDFFVRSGKLVPDEVVIKTVRAWLLSNAPSEKGLLLDGFPRTRAQAVALDEMLSVDVTNFEPCVIVFDLSDEEIERRLTARRICSNKACGSVYSLLDERLSPKAAGVCDRCGAELCVRVDDTPEAVRERLKIYHAQADELINYYRQQGAQVASLPAADSVDNVFSSFIAALEHCDKK